MVSRIERIRGGVAQNRAEPDADGFYHCMPKGKNVDPVTLRTLDEVADWLRANPTGGVRMNPGWTKLSRNLFIDGVPR